MYTKISTGGSFAGAALYDEAGLSEKQRVQKLGKVALLETGNLLSRDALGIAGEMQAVASRSKTLKPVWNISMSAGDGEVLAPFHWKQAAAMNLKALGVDPERFQYAIYHHRDTQHDHIHILLNAVPIDGGPALSRQFNGRKARLAAPAIEEALKRDIAVVNVVAGQSVREQLRSGLELSLARATTPQELTSSLASEGIRIEYKTNQDGIYGLTLQLTTRTHAPVKGSVLQLADGRKAKCAVVLGLLDANKAQQATQTEKVSTTKKPEKTPPSPRKVGKSAGLGHTLGKTADVIPPVDQEQVSADQQRQTDRVQAAEQQRQIILNLHNQFIAMAQRDLGVTFTGNDAKLLTEGGSVYVPGRGFYTQERIMNEIKEADKARRHVPAEPTPASQVVPVQIGTKAAGEPVAMTAPMVADVSKPTLQERFIKAYGFAPSENGLEKLKAGEEVNFGKRGKTIWLQDGRLKSRPYEALTAVRSDAKAVNDGNPTIITANAPAAVKSVPTGAKPTVARSNQAVTGSSSQKLTPATQPQPAATGTKPTDTTPAGMGKSAPAADAALPQPKEKPKPKPVIKMRR